MKVLIVNTSENTGGAAVAANRLCDALNNNGMKARMLVCSKQSTDITVAACTSPKIYRWHFLWERIVIWLKNGLCRTNLFKISIANTGTDITKTREFQEADIVHLHWINQGMLSLGIIKKILQSGKPVVWTMHDMWPLTSICHHAYECNSFTTECRECPFLKRSGRHDMSEQVFHKKQRMLTGVKNLSFVAVSEWLAGKARHSAIIGTFPISVIPNVLSLQQFTIVDRIDARTTLNVEEHYVIAFGAARIDDPIKGLSYLKEALTLLVTSGRFQASDIRVLFFGTLRNANELDHFPVPCTHLGYIDDSYRLSQVYSASNAVVSSSLYETFGQTLIEAMACGCVPVSFDGSGQTDIIIHQKNGYLARRLSSESLSDGIAWALQCHLTPQEQRRYVVRRYSESVVAHQYQNLYNNIMNND